MASEQEQVTFALDLAGNMPEKSEQHAAALESLREKIQGSTGELRGLQLALRNIQAGSVVNIATARDLRDKIGAQKAAIASATDAYAQLGGKFDALRPKPKATAEGIEALLERIRGAPGPVGSLAGKIEKLRESLGGGVIALGLVGIAAAIAIITAAAIAGAGALIKYGLAHADARRNELLHLEALGKIRHFSQGLGGGFRATADKADFLQNTIDKVSGSVALSRDKVAQYTEQLVKMRLRGGNLQAALEGVAITAATLGDEQANAFAQWAAGAAATGQSVRRLADDVKARLGGIAAKQMLSFSVIQMKIRENFDHLFDDLNPGKLAAGFKLISDLFTKSAVEGKALRGIVTRMFNPLFDSMGNGAPLVKRFIQGMIIGLLMTENVILRLRLWWKKTFGGSDILAGINAQTAAVYAGVGVVLLLAAALGTAAISAAMLIAPFVFLGLVIYGGYLAAKKAVQGLDKLAGSMGKVGKSLVDGLIGGLIGGLPGVLVAITSMGKSTLQAFKNVLGIKSPSTKAFAVSFQVPKGAELGITAGSPIVAKASAKLGATALGSFRASLAGKTSADLNVKSQLQTSTRLAASPAVPRMQPANDNPAGAAGLRLGRPNADRRNTPGAKIVTLHVEKVELHSTKPEEIKQEVADAFDEVVERLAVAVGARN